MLAACGTALRWPWPFWGTQAKPLFLRAPSKTVTKAFASPRTWKFVADDYADGAIPLDRWFGTFHDGSDEAQVAMNQRFMARNAAKRGSPA